MIELRKFFPDWAVSFGPKIFKLTNKRVKLTKQLHARKCYQHKILSIKNTGNIELNQQKQPVTRNCYQQQT